MRRTRVLHGVSFSVRKNSIFGLLGPNGAGKTTLIHLMTGIRRPRSGTVRVSGFDAHTSEAKAQIGYLPERPYFHDHLTGRGFLFHMGRLSGVGDSDLGERVPKVLRQVGLEEAMNRELSRYSKGMLQRVGIAQALIHDPETLILDEPMSGLDPLGRKEIRELILSLARGGKTILFSSHIIPDVEAICDEVAVVDRGRLVECGAIGTFLSSGPVRTEVAFAGLTDEFIHAGFSEEIRQRLHSIPNGKKVILHSQEEVGEVLKSILDSQGKVLWVTPVRPSLEDLFIGRRQG